VYPEAHHGFDSPTGKVRLRRDVPNGVNTDEGVHVGPHPASRADAYEKLKAMLEQLSYSVR
jgi:dienelactone hydrolase